MIDKMKHYALALIIGFLGAAAGTVVVNGMRESYERTVRINEGCAQSCSVAMPSEEMHGRMTDEGCSCEILLQHESEFRCEKRPGY